MNNMKRLKLALIAMAMMACYTSCHTSGARTTSAHFITATSTSIGAFNASGINVTTDGAVGAKISIQGEVTGSQRRLIISINPYAGITGPITLGGTSNSAIMFYSALADTLIMSAHGTITLTSVTPDVAGTFSYTGSDSSVVTGSFNAPTP